MALLRSIFAVLDEWLLAIFYGDKHETVPVTVLPRTVEVPPVEQILPQDAPKPPAPAPTPKYDWSTPIASRHSARVIMDEYQLSKANKDLLCACIMQESGFHPKAIGKPNTNGTRDFGLCQFNNGKSAKGVPLWIGPGATFSSVEEVLDDPEKNVRVMIHCFQAGHLNYWSSYKTGAYKQYL